MFHVEHDIQTDHVDLPRRVPSGPLPQAYFIQARIDASSHGRSTETPLVDQVERFPLRYACQDLIEQRAPGALLPHRLTASGPPTARTAARVSIVSSEVADPGASSPPLRPAAEPAGTECMFQNVAPARPLTSSTCETRKSRAVVAEDGALGTGQTRSSPRRRARLRRAAREQPESRGRRPRRPLRRSAVASGSCYRLVPVFLCRESAPAASRRSSPAERRAPKRAQGVGKLVEQPRPGSRRRQRAARAAHPCPRRTMATVAIGVDVRRLHRRIHETFGTSLRLDERVLSFSRAEGSSDQRSGSVSGRLPGNQAHGPAEDSTALTPPTARGCTLDLRTPARDRNRVPNRTDASLDAIPRRRSMPVRSASPAGAGGDSGIT